MVCQPAWHRILSISEEPTSPYLGIMRAQIRLRGSLGVKTALNPYLSPSRKRNLEHLHCTFLMHGISAMYWSAKYLPELWKEWVRAAWEYPEKSVEVWARRSLLEQELSGKGVGLANKRHIKIIYLYLNKIKTIFTHSNCHLDGKLCSYDDSHLQISLRLQEILESKTFLSTHDLSFTSDHEKHIR